MNFKHDDRGLAGLFTTGEGENRAELSYAVSEDKQALIFDHTYVPEQERGHGTAEALVDHAVGYARSKGLKVSPACSYVRTLFERHPDRYADVATGHKTPAVPN